MTPILPLVATVTGRAKGSVRSRLPVGLTGFVVSIVFATVAAASTPLMSWMGGPIDPEASLPVQPAAQAPAAPLAVPGAEGRPRSRSSCDSCGFVESVRQLEPVGNRPASYEFTVRLRDGSSRISSSANTAGWRTGDRIMLIGGTTPSGH
jgi:hypothetical protein